MSVGPRLLPKHRLRNWLQTVLLVSGMVVLCLLLGWCLGGGLEGLLILGTTVALLALLAPRISARLVFRMYRATPLSRRRAPGLVRTVTELSKRAGLDRAPRLYYIPSRMINAFAVGTRGDAGLGITDGLLRGLDPREIVGVLAHEITHLRNGDLRVMSLADLVTRTVHFFSWTGQLLLFVNLPLHLLGAEPFPWLLILLLIFAPTLSALLQLALSRQREFDADLGAVELTGDPRGLASALQKMERLQGGFLERIFLPGRRIPEPSLLRTHPETEDRVRRLLQLEPEDRAALVKTLDPVHRPARDPGDLPRPSWHVTGLWH